jgi:general secretion pathway protein G
MVSAMFQRAFTLIELLVVLAVTATLLSLVAPQYMGSIDAAKEQVLRENLASLRATLDKFHADTGRYPESLDELVTARYLRSVPLDPFTNSSATGC